MGCVSMGGERQDVSEYLTGLLSGRNKEGDGKIFCYGDAGSNSRHTGYCQWLGSTVLEKI